MRYTPLSSPLTKGGQRGVIFVPHQVEICCNKSFIERRVFEQLTAQGIKLKYEQEPMGYAGINELKQAMSDTGVWMR
ncbi:hypothetical protein F7734_32815 [Scytonema sp. UIC 10036]|uniref:hypothetical protein n=1 Tax=Scytonema sp. UIC 10036 TaxID=2304196 RepID=UPI0012DA2BC0|nr:hypothetical protein [Scytonema sp. UIC 10036]MUG96868.1 hypothetical protein [Scytonema sp. UIC 10036]